MDDWTGGYIGKWVIVRFVRFGYRALLASGRWIWIVDEITFDEGEG